MLTTASYLGPSPHCRKPLHCNTPDMCQTSARLLRSVHVELPDIQTPRLFEIPDKFFYQFYRRPEQKIAEDFEVPEVFFDLGVST